jgi:phosphohistidine phosphatase
MKSLLVLRHAKSDWSSDRLEDIDRPLAHRGRRDLPRVAGVLGRLEVRPGIILHSPAARARETAVGLTERLDHLPEPRVDERLYLAGPAVLSEVLGEQDDRCAVALLVGHNPGMEEWIERLCGARVRLPTAGMALIEFGTGSWSEAAAGSGQLLWLVVPRLLAS